MVSNKEKKRASLERDLAELTAVIKRGQELATLQLEGKDVVAWTITQHQLKVVVRAREEVDRKLAELDMTWGERLFGPLLGAEWVSRFLSFFGRKK